MADIDFDLDMDDEPQQPSGQALTPITDTADDQREVAQVQLSEWIGQRKFSVALQKLLTVSDLVELQKVKESKAYKGLAVVIAGKVQTVSSFKQLCDSIGISEQHVSEQLLNLKTFGPEFIEYSDKHLGFRDVRALRKLPDDEREALIEVAKAGDKDQLLDLAESLIVKHAQEKEGLQAQIRDKAADVQKADERANRLNLEVEKKQDTIDTLRKAQNLNPEFSLETNIIRQQSALLDQQCAVSLAALHEMAVTVTDEEQDSPEWPVRMQSVWFAAHAAYARSLQLVQALRDLDVHGLAIPTDPDHFKAGIFTADEAKWFADEVDINRAALANALTKKRVDMKEAAPRKPGRPAKQTK